jgi:HEAT repeat protein
MEDLFEQAQEAAMQGNWSQLNHCLQQLLFSSEVQSIGTQPSVTSDKDVTQNLELLLSLALQVLEMGDFRERWEVAKIFPTLGEVAIDPLVQFLQDEELDPETRWFAARILGAFNHPTTITALIDVIQTCDDEELRSIVASALANFGNDAIAVLNDLLQPESTRLLAVQILSQVRTTATIAPLLQVANDAQVAVRATAIEALSSFHDQRIPPILMAALQDPAVEVRRLAVHGLSFRADLLTEFDLVSLIKPLLFDVNLEVCRQSAIALGRLGTPTAIAALLQVLRSPYTPELLGLEVVRSLGRTEQAAALDGLQQELTRRSLQFDSSLQLSQEIVHVLGQVQTPEMQPKAAQILVQALQMPSLVQLAHLKQSIAFGLGQLGDQSALEPLLQLLEDSDLGVRLHVVAALKKLAPETAYQRLQQLATKTTLQPAMQQGVAIALQEWQSQVALN